MMKVLLLLLLLFTTSLFCDDYDYHSKKHINKELSHIKLSKAQTKQIKNYLHMFRKEIKAYRKFKKKIEKERKNIFLKENLDIEALNQLNQKLDKKAHEIENRLLEKIHAILSLKQRVRFINYFDDWEVE